MKRLTRMNLDELAKTMPVISEKKQSEYIGSAKYFNESGVLLGDLGIGDELRIISQTEFNELINKQDTDFNKLYGTDLASAHQGARYGVVMHYAREYGFNNVQFNADMPYEAAIINGQLVFKPNSFVLINASSLRSTLQHEQSHMSGCMKNTAECEIGTLLKQIKAPEYKTTNQFYRQFTAECLFERVMDIKKEISEDPNLIYNIQDPDIVNAINKISTITDAQEICN